MDNKELLEMMSEIGPAEMLKQMAEITSAWATGEANAGHGTFARAWSSITDRLRMTAKEVSDEMRFTDF